MQVSHSIQIRNSSSNVWNTLRSFEGIENYLPIVTKSKVEGSGQGSKRICEVSIGNQVFQTQETLQVLDEVNRSLVVYLDNGPIQLRGMIFKFSVKEIDENNSQFTISTTLENPDAASMAENLFEMICQGLKKFHEI